MVQFWEVNSEIAAGTRGSSLGIDALKIVDYQQEKSILNQFTYSKINNYNTCLADAYQFKHAKRIETFNTHIEQMISQFKRLSSQAFPLFLASDHGNAVGSITSLKLKYPKKRIGVVWIDAHADLHTPYTTPSGNIHGMPLAALAGLDNKGHQRNQVSDELLQNWETLKSCGGISPKILPSDIVFVAGRSYEKEEMAIIDQYQLRHITVEEYRSSGISIIQEAISTQLAACDLIFVSFDVDSMDPSVSVGTGTPVPNGLSLEEAISINKALAGHPKICAWEIVEINPLLDTKNAMAQAAYQVLREVFKVCTNN